VTGMSDSTTLIRVPDLARLYDFGPTHPLRPERVLGTLDHIARLGMIDEAGVEEVDARNATDDEIRAVHSAEFVTAVRDVDAGVVTSQFGLQYGVGTPDNPIFPDMHTASAAVCGASVTAAEVVVTGEAQHAFNPAGGLHHARRSEASGFCIYNDPAVAIARVLAMRPDWRVMYIDVDVHHGDGVQWIFYDEPRVLTLSLHQSGRYLYPGTGFTDELGSGDAVGTSANLPFMPFTGNDDYLWALEALVNGLAEAYKPDLVLTQLGADTHHGDPLANLGLTMEAYPRMGRILHDAIHAYGSGRWVATGGGGYQAETVVPKVWTMHFAELCGVPEMIPSEWLNDNAPDEVSRRFRDSVRDSVDEVLGACVPHLEKLAST
jgi:acetoin utilization protein AcuC